MRRLSCRSVPMMQSPPASSASSFSRATSSRIACSRLSRSGLVRRRRRARARTRMSSVAAELDVGAAAGHVGGDRDRAGHAGLRDDVGLLLVVAGVQDVKTLPSSAAVDTPRPSDRRNRAAASPLAQRSAKLRLLDRGRADQHRLAALAALVDQLEDRLVLLLHRPVDRVVLVDARSSARWSAPRPRRGCRCS